MSLSIPLPFPPHDAAARDLDNSLIDLILDAPSGPRAVLERTRSEIEVLRSALVHALIGNVRINHARNRVEVRMPEMEGSADGPVFIKQASVRAGNLDDDVIVREMVRAVLDVAYEEAMRRARLESPPVLKVREFYDLRS